MASGFSSYVHTFQVTQNSDGDITKGPARGDGIQDDEWCLKKLGEEWAKDDASGVYFFAAHEYRFNAMPAGYRCFVRKTGTRSTHYSIYGGEHTYKSFKAFWPHFRWLQIDDNTVPCTCMYCRPEGQEPMPAPAPIQAPAPVSAAAPAPQPFLIPATLFQADFRLSPEAVRLHRLMRENSASRGDAARQNRAGLAVKGAFYASIGNHAWHCLPRESRNSVLSGLTDILNEVAHEGYRNDVENIIRGLQALVHTRLLDGIDTQRNMTAEHKATVDDCCSKLLGYCRLILENGNLAQWRYRQAVDEARNVLPAVDFHAKLEIICMICFISPHETFATDSPLWESLITWAKRFAVGHRTA